MPKNMRFEDLLSPKPLDKDFVSRMEKDINNDPNRKDELEYYKATQGSNVYSIDSSAVHNYIKKNGELVRNIGKKQKFFKLEYYPYAIYKCEGMQFGLSCDPSSGFAEATGKKSDLKKIWELVSKGTKQLHDSLSLIKENLFDASEEVKKSFNDIVKYFTSIPRDLDNYILWRSISIKDKNTGDSVTLYGDGDFGVYTLQHEPNERQKAVLGKLNLTVKKTKIQVGPSEFKDYILVNADPHKFGKNLKNLNSSSVEVHGVPDPGALKYLKEEGYDVSQLKQFDDQNYRPKSN